MAKDHDYNWRFEISPDFWKSAKHSEAPFKVYHTQTHMTKQSRYATISDIRI